MSLSWHRCLADWGEGVLLFNIIIRFPLSFLFSIIMVSAVRRVRDIMTFDDEMANNLLMIKFKQVAFNYFVH